MSECVTLTTTLTGRKNPIWTLVEELWNAYVFWEPTKNSICKSIFQANKPKNLQMWSQKRTPHVILKYNRLCSSDWPSHGQSKEGDGRVGKWPSTWTSHEDGTVWFHCQFNHMTSRATWTWSLSLLSLKLNLTNPVARSFIMSLSLCQFPHQSCYLQKSITIAGYP